MPAILSIKNKDSQRLKTFCTTDILINACTAFVFMTNCFPLMTKHENEWPRAKSYDEMQDAHSTTSHNSLILLDG